MQVYRTIIKFFKLLLIKIDDSIPENGEFQLPNFQTQEGYAVYSLEFSRIYSRENPSSLSYFISLWIDHCGHIKFGRSPRFQKFADCDRLRVAIRTTVNENMPSMEFIPHQRLHHEFILRKRCVYRVNTELAKDHAFISLSIILDGADQSSLALPRSVTRTKEHRGHGIGIYLTGFIEHAPIHHLRMYTMTHNHSTDANHIGEVIHRVINDKTNLQKLPKKVFLPLDNCSRENKNKYLMGYFDSLGQWEVLDEIEASILLAGHTHSDSDQDFSTTAGRFRAHDSVTLRYCLEELFQCFNERTGVKRMDSRVN